MTGKKWIGPEVMTRSELAGARRRMSAPMRQLMFVTLERLVRAIDEMPADILVQYPDLSHAWQDGLAIVDHANRTGRRGV